MRPFTSSWSARLVEAESEGCMLSMKQQDDGRNCDRADYEQHHRPATSWRCVATLRPPFGDQRMLILVGSGVQAGKAAAGGNGRSLQRHEGGLGALIPGNAHEAMIESEW